MTEFSLEAQNQTLLRLAQYKIKLLSQRLSEIDKIETRVNRIFGVKMNCNDTLDAILDGEFSPSPGLDSHLLVCARCRSLLVALSPMIEQGSAAESVGSVSFSEDQTCSQTALDVALLSASRLQVSLASPESQVRFSSKKLKYVAAFLAGVATSFGGLAVIRSEPIQSSPALPTVCLWESDFNAQQFETGVIERRRAEEDLVRSCVACHLIAQK